MWQETTRVKTEFIPKEPENAYFFLPFSRRAVSKLFTRR
jgi:hypothetical protein